MYTALKDIQLGPVNLVGIVTMTSEPLRTRNGGMYQFTSYIGLPDQVLRLDAFYPYRRSK